MSETATTTGLPDDLVLEYDMLQLIDGDDGIFLGTHVSPSASLYAEAEDLLENCSVDVSIATSTSSDLAISSNTSCASSVCISGGAGYSSVVATKSQEVEANLQDEVAEFLLDGVQFLRDMEQGVTVDLNNENQKKWTALEQSHDGINLDAFMMPSPCPSVLSTYSVARNRSPCKNGVEKLELKCPEPRKTREEEEPEKQARKYHESSTGYVLPSVSPRKLPRVGSSFSEVPDASSLGYADGIASTSMLPSTSKEAVKDSTIHDEDEEIEEEVMEDEIDLLQKEAKYLDAHKDFLQSRAKSMRRQRKCIKQRCPRQSVHLKPLVKSQEDNQLLNDLVAQQKIYQDNFQAMLALAPVNDVRMALMTPMESFIRLGKDFDERRKIILSLREEKLDMAYKFIEQKAVGLDVNRPYQYSDMFEKFGKHYCVSFAISRYDGVSVFQVGRAIYELIAGNDEVLNSAAGTTTIRESFDTIKCSFLHQRIVSSMHWEGEETDKMPDMESNAIFYCRFDDNSAVLATDYIDHDDLHPYDTSSHIRKDVASGVVLSGHTDADGKKFVIMKRYLMAKYHMYPHKMSQEQQDHFLASMPKCHDTMKTLVINRLQKNETCAGEE